jgi:ABC-type glycerol-3-phosphate transport system permease component
VSNQALSPPRVSRGATGADVPLLRAIVRPMSLAYVITGFYCLSSVLALIWMIYTSLKSDKDLFGHGPWALPAAWHFENYADAWHRAHIANYFFNSFYLSAVSTVIAVVITAMAAYVISRIAFRGNRLVLYYLIAALMVPGFLYVVPLYLLMVQQLQLSNNHVGLILLYITGSIPFNTFVLTGFFKTLPTELEEAAAIDGASANRVFWQVMLPLAQPGLLTVAVFSFIGNWNEFFWSLVLLRDKDLFTLSRGLYNLYLDGQYEAQWTMLFAGILIATVPILVVFVVLQDLITEGLTVGALKG